MLYDFARPFIFLLDPETAHDVAFKNLDRVHALGLTRLLRPHVADDPVEVMGLRFPNPVGLAAGLDKNAEHIDALANFGFGFIEVGTVTPRPQPGNAKPRLFRLPSAQALINRLGFNNQGLDHFVTQVQASRARDVVLGLNIGKNADTPIERALDDYVIGLRRVYPLLIKRPGYVTVNISSPNTRNLRTLQVGAELVALLTGLRQARKKLADEHGQRVPLAVKIAPDLDDADLPRIADTLVKHEIDAVIATNTTLARDRVTGLPHGEETGGLSGRPLADRSTEVVRILAQHLKGTLPIIGVGGILDGQGAVAKLAAGASLVQIYTGLIYRGPPLIGECRRAILRYRKQDHRWTKSPSAKAA